VCEDSERDAAPVGQIRPALSGVPSRWIGSRIVATAARAARPGGPSRDPSLRSGLRPRLAVAERFPFDPTRREVSHERRAIEIEAIGTAGTELARYRLSEGERVLMGWRRGGGVEVTDRPAAGRHRAFVVDRGFRCGEQLTAFVGDYIGQTVRIDACPMSGAAIATMLAASEASSLAPLFGEAAR
jgi:hypothetical protein